MMKLKASGFVFAGKLEEIGTLSAIFEVKLVLFPIFTKLVHNLVLTLGSEFTHQVMNWLLVGRL